MNKRKYQVRLTNRFKKHLKLIAKRNIDNVRKINDTVKMIENGETLPERY